MKVHRLLAPAPPGGVDHNLQTDRTTGDAEAAWKVTHNTDFALSASPDAWGGSRVGVGLRF